ERRFSYCRPAVMNDYFERENLSAREGKSRNRQITCDHLKRKQEGLQLEHMDHFRSHVQRVRSVWPRPGRRRAYPLEFGMAPVHTLPHMFLAGYH
ncbi:hypothetical protein EDB81DRAFT_633263, partial [Dactylonectria macrodidyma]